LLFSSFFIFLPSSVFGFHYRDRVSPAPVSLELITGIQERDIVQKSESLDPCCKFKGDAVTSRLLARLGIEAFNRVEVFGLFGGTDLEISEFDGFDSSLDLAYGGGINLILYESPFPVAFHIFLEYTFFTFDAQDRVEIERTNGFTLHDEEINWKEHIIKIGGDSRYRGYRSYGGFRFSFVRGDENFPQVRVISGPGPFPEIAPAKIEEDDFVGVFGGMDFFLDPKDSLVLNIEVSLFDVNSIQGSLRFML